MLSKKAKPTTVEAYLKGLPPERRAAVAAVREVILKHLPEGYTETMGYGIVTYAIPLDRYPTTYNGQPMCIAALGTHQKYNSLYLMGAYGSPKRRKALEDGFRKAGKKLDMGKSCVHFKTAEDLPLDVIADTIAAIPPDTFIQMYERSRRRPRN